MLLTVQAGHAHRVGYHWALVHKQEECLLWMKLETSSDDGHELSNGDVVWNQEFAPIHEWKTALSIEPFDDHRDFVWLLASDFFHIFLTFVWNYYWLGFDHCHSENYSFDIYFALHWTFESILLRNVPLGAAPPVSLSVQNQLIFTCPTSITSLLLPHSLSLKRMTREVSTLSVYDLFSEEKLRKVEWDGGFQTKRGRRRRIKWRDRM